MGPDPSPYAARRAALLAGLPALDVEGMLIASDANRRYLTGFTGSSGVVAIVPGDAVLFTDFRYREQAEDEVGSEIRVDIVRRDPRGAAVKWLRHTGVETAGFEADHTVEVVARGLRGRRKPRFRPLAGLVERQRIVKDAREIARIGKAAEIAEAALDATIPVLGPGRREIDIAAHLERELRIRGSEWHPFETIVASGPRSALPHARTTERAIRAGDLVLIDFGARFEGYCADVTRTFVVGAPASERQRTVYAMVREAQTRALEGLRAGMSGGEADGLARVVMDRQGFGDAFGHSLGHGLGLEVHEEPRLAAGVEATLPAGAVVTVEPGAYFPGWGGVRIEDDVHLTPGGVDRLTHGSTELFELT